MTDQSGTHLTADAALRLGRAESRWLKQARQRLRADPRPARHTPDRNEEGSR